MQLTMEPLEEMLASARVMDQAGMDTIWLAEAYPWWRKHGMEARSSTVVSALKNECEHTTIPSGVPTTTARSCSVCPGVRASTTDGASTRPSHSESSHFVPR